jgi:inorganic pyrophosphatase
MNLNHIALHKEYPNFVNAVIEIPKGTSAKYEYHEDGYFFYDRSLSSAMVYPASYGFIPNTFGDDGDPIDVLVYNATPIERGTVVECKVIGVLDMDDDNEKDYKILGVPTSHVRNFNSMRRIDSLFLDISKNFFAHYKDLNNKKVEVHEWHEKEKAYEILKKGIKV